MNLFCNPEKTRIGTVLLQKGLINREQLNQALTVQRINHLQLGEILLQQDLITSAQLQQALLEQRCLNLSTTVFFCVRTCLKSFRPAS